MEKRFANGTVRCSCSLNQPVRVNCVKKFAGARDPSRRIADTGALERYQEVAVQLVGTCLLARRGEATRTVLRGVPLLLELLEKLAELELS